MGDNAPAPPGYRFSAISKDNHAGLIYVAAFLGLAYTTLNFIARAAVRFRMLGPDDWTFLGTQILYFTQFGLLLAAVNAGLAKEFTILSNDEYQRMASLQYGYHIMYFLCVGLAKVATLMLVQRLFTQDVKKFWLLCHVINGLMCTWTVLAALLISVGCSPSSEAPVTSAQTCPSIAGRYKAIVATDVITDFILIALPIYLVWQLQMPRTLKLKVIAAFAFRVPLLALSILGGKYFVRSLSSSRPGVERADAIVIHQVQLCYSLVAATIPCLTGFMRSFDTFRGMQTTYNAYAEGSAGVTKMGSSYRMHDLSAANNSATRSRNKGDDEDALRTHPAPFPGVNTTQTSEAPGPDDDAASTHHGSQELIIRRDVYWEVRSEAKPNSVAGRST